MANYCEVCGKKAYSNRCVLHKVRKPIKTTKRLKQRGKQYYEWQETRRLWFELHPALWYYCHYCGVQMDKTATTLDHILSRSSKPELRHTLNNLVPCCFFDNTRKGSMSYGRYVEKYYPHLLADIPKPSRPSESRR